VSAVLLEVGVTGNPLPLPMVLLPCVSAWIFLARKADEHPRSWPTAFVIAFYLCIVVQGLAHT
jgi:hypothetical protein